MSIPLCLFPCVQWRCCSSCFFHSSTTSGNTSNMHAIQMGLQATCMYFKWDCKVVCCCRCCCFSLVFCCCFVVVFVRAGLILPFRRVYPLTSKAGLTLPFRRVYPLTSKAGLTLPFRRVYPLPLRQVSPYPSDVYTPYLHGRSHLTLQTCISLTFRAGFTAFTTNAPWVHTVWRRAARQHAGGILLPKVTLTVLTAVGRCPHVPGLHDGPIRSEAGSEVSRYAEGIRSIFGSRNSPVGCVELHGAETDHVAHGHHLAVLDDRACRRPAVFSWWVERVLYLLS